MPKDAGRVFDGHGRRLLADQLNQRQACVAIAGALRQKIAELHSVAVDTHGFTHFAMAAAKLLGFPDRRLASLGPAFAYPGLAPLMGKRIRADVITEHWDDVLRLVASLKTGAVAPSTMLKKLAAYERQNQLDLALQEIGRAERTPFVLD